MAKTSPSGSERTKPMQISFAQHKFCASSRLSPHNAAPSGNSPAGFASSAPPSAMAATTKALANALRNNTAMAKWLRDDLFDQIWCGLILVRFWWLETEHAWINFSCRLISNIENLTYARIWQQLNKNNSPLTGIEKNDGGWKLKIRVGFEKIILQ